MSDAALAFAFAFAFALAVAAAAAAILASCGHSIGQIWSIWWTKQLLDWRDELYSIGSGLNQRPSSARHANAQIIWPPNRARVDSRAQSLGPANEIAFQPDIALRHVPLSCPVFSFLPVKVVLVGVVAVVVILPLLLLLLLLARFMTELIHSIGHYTITRRGYQEYVEVMLAAAGHRQSTLGGQLAAQKTVSCAARSQIAIKATRDSSPLFNFIAGSQVAPPPPSCNRHCQCQAESNQEEFGGGGGSIVNSKAVRAGRRSIPSEFCYPSRSQPAGGNNRFG